MKRYIDVRIDKDHCYYCSNKIIARQNENNSTAFRIQLLEEMLDKWIYMEFQKPNGEKVCTTRLEVKNGVAIYDIPNTLTDHEGELSVEIVIRDSDNVVWKSYRKTYLIDDAINAAETIEEANPDFITEAQTLLDEINEGLTPSIGDNENWFVCGKDTGKPSRGPKGDNYIITEEDLEEVETQVKTDIQPILENIENVAKQAEVIAKGRATGYVFDTAADLDLWLQNVENTSKLVLGDNLYIRAIGVPDYWWDGTTKQVLETEKPDLTAYVKQDQLVTLTQEAYDKLTEKGANTIYYIQEQEE